MATLVCLGGCMSGPGSTDYDPLRGGRPLPASGASKSPARGGVDSGPDVLLAADTGVASPAALASSTSPRGGDEKPPAANPDVKVLPPRPVASTVQPIAAATNKTTAPATGPVPVTAASYEQLQQELQTRGVVWQLLKTGVADGEWFFACAIPDPNNAGVQRHYEGRAVGPHGLAAIRAVLKEIDDDVKQRAAR
jgi:hypothetical protein